MAHIETGHDYVRLTGEGRTELHIGLTVGGKQMYIGVQDRAGRVDCIDLIKPEVDKLTDRLTEMQHKMKDPVP